MINEILLVLLCMQMGLGLSAEPSRLRGTEESNSGSLTTLVHRVLSIKTDWFTGESVSTYDGDVPRTTCPVGKYRVSSGSNLFSNKGLRVDGCIPCPRGTYGDVEGLTAATCSGTCPKGRYSDRIGLSTVEDCKPCDVGRYGSSLGLTTSACTATCASGYYTAATASEASTDCVECPAGYSDYPCDQGLTVRYTRNTGS